MKKTPVAIITALIITSSCSNFSSSDKKIEKQMEDAVPWELVYSQWREGQIRVLRTTTPREAQLLFIHGAPGSLSAASSYFQPSALTDIAQVISYDRPGFGKSDYGNTVLSIAEQAAAARSLIRPGAIVVGHSFGGSIALRMAMDYPDDIAAAVILAGSMAAEHEKIWFFNRPAEWPVFNWMLSPAWKLTNREKLSHLEELPLFDDLWDDIRVPIVIIHGTKDSLVPYENALYAMERIPHPYARLASLEGEDHFILWSHRELIIPELLSIINSD